MAKTRDLKGRALSPGGQADIATLKVAVSAPTPINVAYNPLRTAIHSHKVKYMQQRCKFYSGQFYHVCNKSIANYSIFRTESFSQRFLDVVDYYNTNEEIQNFGKTKLLKNLELPGLLNMNDRRIIDIYAYCVMPDHYHLLFEVIGSESITNYISKVQNSYTRFYNLQNRRKGPLWQSHFRVAEISSDEQLLHVSRYIHLNPTTNKLVAKPEEWQRSSYSSYINSSILKEKKALRINSIQAYRSFVEGNIDYQQKLKKIKKLLLD